MWCVDADETIEFFKGVDKPWVAFKVLAAGAIPPRKAFAHAFKNGADFIAVGMFDWQVQEDCDLVKRLVRREVSRERAWRA
jgi:NAD(P)H-dependent flavin oxidoreductase YrpB (nitropropane dioxygenase family)